MRVKITAAKLTLLGLGLVGIGVITPAMAGDVYVIAHPSVALDEDQIREVYLGEKQFAGAVKLVPVDNSSVQSDFLERVVSMRADKYASMWVKKGFRGDATAPATKSGDAEVIKFVKSTSGAIGYVSSPVKGVKELYHY